MRLPTVLGKQLLSEPLKPLMKEESDAYKAVAAFQRMALVANFDTSCKALAPWFKNKDFKKAVDKDLLTRLQMVHDTVKQDCLGHALDAIMHLMDGATGATKDKMACAAIVHEIFGDKQIIKDEKLSDKLVIGLVGKGE